MKITKISLVTVLALGSLLLCSPAQDLVKLAASRSGRDDFGHRFLSVNGQFPPFSWLLSKLIVAHWQSRGRWRTCQIGS